MEDWQTDLLLVAKTLSGLVDDMVKIKRRAASNPATPMTLERVSDLVYHVKLAEGKARKLVTQEGEVAL